MNYETLLLKYLNHVLQCEGLDFTDRLNERHSGSEVEFTHDEVVVLQYLSRSNRSEDGA